jgi:general secretion pathway protein D
MEDGMRHFVRRGKSAANKNIYAAALCLTALTLAPVTAQAQAPVSAAVTLDVREARLEDAVQLLTKQTGVDNVVFVNVPGKAFGVVTVKMTDQPFEKVLRAMAASAEASVSLEDGVYYVRPRGAESDAPKPKQPETAVAVAPVKKRNLQTVMLPLQFMLPSHFEKFIKNEITPELLSQDPRRAILEEEIRNQRKSTVELSPVQQPRYIGNDQSPANSSPARPVGEGLSAGRSDDSAGQRGGFGGGQGGPGGIGGGGGGRPGGGGGAQGGQGGQGGFLPEGVEQIISYDANNTLLVRGDSEGIEELRALIRFLDVKPKQVQVKVEFVQLNITDTDQFGIDWQFKFANNLGTNIASQGGSAPTLTLAYASGNTVANLRLSLIRNTGNLLQSPIISTTNNTPASITFSQQQPIFTAQTLIAAGGIAQSIPQIQYIPVTNFLTVTPHINGDNSISMALSPQLARQSNVNGPDGQSAPAITSQFLTTYRTVQSGDTIVLGGFITRQEDREVQKVPFLSDLPIIGSLFTQTNRTVVGNEVLVFVTPTIIEDRSQGNTGTIGSAPPTP